MLIGPNGERRPADPVAQAVMIGRIATGDVEDERINLGKSTGGRKGARARANALSAKRRSEIAKVAAAARWDDKSAKLKKGHPDTPTPRHPDTPN